jgi:hypothetical protein
MPTFEAVKEVEGSFSARFMLKDYSRAGERQLGNSRTTAGDRCIPLTLRPEARTIIFQY